MPLKPFIGNWTGEGGGEPGRGKYERSYQFVLNGNFIEVKNKASYPAKTADKPGEVHEDVAYFSFDNATKLFKLRQFRSDGAVNEYVLDSISPDRQTYVFVTESVENMPGGYRARQMFRFVNDKEFGETFEVAAPGKNFVVYTKAIMRKQD